MWLPGPESVASGRHRHLSLKDLQRQTTGLTTTHTLSNYNGSSKDSSKEINEKESEG
jgi:hypothetical protein